MPYIRIFVHINWSTKRRAKILSEDLKKELFQHISENASKKGIYIEALGGVLDHVHVLLSLSSNQTVAQMAQLLKGESSHWVNKNKLTRLKFEWQEEYYAESVSISRVDAVRRYINNQVEHHRRKSYEEEYQNFLKRNGFGSAG